MNLKNMVVDCFVLLKKCVFQIIFYNVDWDNIKKLIYIVVKVFKEYFIGRNIFVNFENLFVVEFDKKFLMFYCRMRNRNKDMYGKGIFILYRYSVQYYLEIVGKKFEIFMGEVWNVLIVLFR